MREDHSAFAACLLQSNEGTEVAQGSLLLNHWRLRFESEALTLEIPLTRLQIEVGESEEAGMFFRDPLQRDWLVQVFDSQILDHPSLQQQAHTRNQIRNLRSSDELKRRLQITGWFLAGFALLAVGVWLMTGVMVGVLVQRIPPKWEKDLGDTLFEEVSSEVTFVEDPKFKARLDQAVLPLMAALPTNNIEFKFHIVQERDPNAFALPGGHVLVNEGLLELADRPEQVAGVLAHEIAHVTKKHGFRKIISAAGPYLVFRIFMRNSSGMLGMLGDSSQLLVRQSFSQEYELEADAVGWQYLMTARIDPRGLAEMLKKLQAEEARMRGREFELGAFSSHPSTEKRIQRLESKWNKLKEKPEFEPLASRQ